jgi:hypothetical protein
VRTWTWIVVLVTGVRVLAEGPCGDDRSMLFSCETARKDRFITICAREVVQGKTFADTQYIFGRDGQPELIYPSNPQDGKTRLFFSHRWKGDDYTVSIRFVSGAYTYRVTSVSHHAESNMDPAGSGPAGVEVTDVTGKRVARIECIERPYMFIDYLRLATACDLAQPLGAAACGEKPPVVK